MKVVCIKDKEYDFTDTVSHETWDDMPEWYVLYYYRICKKILKAWTGFIEGSVGRKNAVIIDDIDTYNYNQRYKRSYSEGFASYGESYIKRTNFNAISTDTKRFRCLEGDTLVDMWDGKKIMIKDLKDYIGECVVSYDVINNEKVPGKVINWGLTDKNRKLIRVYLENNLFIDCTPDHRFLLKNGTYKEAQYLTDDDDIMSS